MMKKFLFPPVLMAALAPSFASGLTEDFESYTDGTSVSDLPQWVRAGDNTGGIAAVQEKGGRKESKALVIDQSHIFAMLTAAQPVWRKQDGPAEISFDFFLSGEVSDFNVVISEDEYAGFWINIDPREIKVSEGGETAFLPDSKAYPAEISPGQWYTAQIRDVNLASPGSPGEAVTGKLYLFESDSPGNKILDGITIKAAGKDRAFSLINHVAFRRFGGAPGETEIKIDNLRIGEEQP